MYCLYKTGFENKVYQINYEDLFVFDDWYKIRSIE